VNAAPHPLVGAERVARFVLGLARAARRGAKLTFAEVNGSPGIVSEDPQGVLNVTVFTLDGGRITAIDIVRNPDKLVHVRRPA
jgi:RNA polymerase sigma-70 factor (ECF subfamily)